MRVFIFLLLTTIASVVKAQDTLHISCTAADPSTKNYYIVNIQSDTAKFTLQYIDEMEDIYLGIGKPVFNQYPVYYMVFYGEKTYLEGVSIFELYDFSILKPMPIMRITKWSD